MKGGMIMTVVFILLGICAVVLIAEACYIMPDKLPWRKKDENGKR